MNALILLLCATVPEDNMLITVSKPQQQVARSHSYYLLESSLSLPNIINPKVQDPNCDCGDNCDCITCNGNCGPQYVKTYNSAVSKQTGMVVQCGGTNKERGSAQKLAASLGYEYVEVEPNQFKEYRVGTTVCDYNNNQLLIRKPVTKNSAFYTYIGPGHWGINNTYTPSYNEAVSHVVNEHGINVTDDMSLDQILTLHDQAHSGGVSSQNRTTQRFFSRPRIFSARCANCN